MGTIPFLTGVLCKKAFITFTATALSAMEDAFTDSNLSVGRTQTVIDETAESIAEIIAEKFADKLPETFQSFIDDDQYGEVRKQWIQDCIEKVPEPIQNQLIVKCFLVRSLDNGRELFVNTFYDKCFPYIEHNYSDDEQSQFSVPFRKYLGELYDSVINSHEFKLLMQKVTIEEIHASTDELKKHLNDILVELLNNSKTMHSMGKKVDKILENNLDDPWKNHVSKEAVTFDNSVLKKLFDFLEEVLEPEVLLKRLNIKPEDYVKLKNGTFPSYIENHVPDLEQLLSNLINEVCRPPEENNGLGKLKELKREFGYSDDEFIWQGLLVNIIVKAALEGAELSKPLYEDMKKQAERVFNASYSEIVENEKKANVLLGSKQDGEAGSYNAIQSRFALASKITLMVFAGTSFFAGLEINDFYSRQESGRLWLAQRLDENKVELDIILTNPSSYAGYDASLYKMKVPGTSVEDSHNIINNNIRRIFELKKQYPKATITLRISDIVLPYGVIFSEGSPYHRDSMKVDLYSPLRDGCDMDRLSFTIRETKNTHGEGVDTQYIWSSIKNAINYVRESPSTRVILDQTGVHRDFKWLVGRNNFDYKTIVHRGRMYTGHKEHNVHGYWACIRAKRPIEVDVLELQDGNQIICREDIVNLPNQNRKSVKISSLTLPELRRCLDEDNAHLPFYITEVMELNEFLDMIGGKIPLLIELKIPVSDDNIEENNSICEPVVKRFWRNIQYYQGSYAVHACNPWAIKALRNIAPLIPIGQITWTFSGLENKIPEYYLNIHKNLTFTEIIRSDFISQKLSEVLPNPITDEHSERLSKLEELGIPIISWSDVAFSAKLTKEMLHSVENDICNHVVEARADL